MLVHERLLSGLRSYAALRLFTQLTSWLGTVYVVRELDSHAVGQYGVALVVFNYLSMVYDGTLLEALVQHPPATRIERRAAFTLLAGVGLLLAGAVVALSGPVARLVGDATVAPLVEAVGGALLLTSFCVLPQSSLAREMEFGRLATIGAIQAVCVTAVSVLLAYLGAGAWALAAGLLAGAAVRCTLLNAAASDLVPPTLHLESAVRYLRFGGVLFADNLLWRWYTSLDTFLLGRWAGTTLLGFYSLAQQVAELPLEKISTVVNDISLPAYVQMSRDRGAAGALMLETMRSHATVGFPVFWGLAAVAYLAVPVLFGDKWNDAVFPLAALAAVAPLRLIGSIETPAMTGLGAPQVLLKTKLVIAPCMTVALLLGCAGGGIRGAALAWLTVFPVCYGLAFRYVLRAVGLSYKQLFAAIRGPAVAAGITALGALLASRGVLAAGAGLALALGAAILVGAIAYVLALQWVDPGSYSLARRRLGRFLGLGPAT